ncbi:membrane-associated zinc metalloprotease [Ectothiorhodospira sp. PHS-1]|uniref:RIP metalloprotease RseP n=1 Tax=Ectothiorhodospira sp. PHS-1 TaxID=519989 RepID=UPI00024A8324|nr:RIP metalloprotease RseP [Ectothiorhodospira sp. PHS-1]EHQ52714.1 membrane-associated zinc metalloprotease [Ectothiorhodospira sp. PHS-1]
MSILISILAFIVAIGLLVTVHEFGHYWVARRCGVKVQRFSIGFGRPLWTRVAGRDRTEYVIAAIPLGGYVKMLDEREEPVPEAERHRAFNRQTVGRRMAIVAAGPAANFLFAILAYTLMFMVGVGGIKPVVGHVEPGSLAAEGGFEARDLILRVNETETATWELAALNLLEQGLDGRRVEVLVRDAEGREVVRSLDLSDRRRLLDEGPLLDKLGIVAWHAWSEPVLGELIPEGAAARAGLRSGDRILQADGIRIDSWQSWVAHVQARPEQPIELWIERDGRREFMVIRTDSREVNGERVGLIGAYPHVDEATAEAMRAQVRHGPWISFVHGVERTWAMSVMTLRVMWRLLTGEAAVSNIAGPISIAEYAGVTAVIGLSAFLGFLAIVSISLGIINLLPIPILDGGHLLYYCVELIKGSPVSPTVEAIGQRVGIVMIGLLMTLAFYNDFMRILG